MTYTKDFSVIIPCWRGAIKFLPRLFDSIPETDGIEIIVVDNSKDPVSRDEIESPREITFLHSSPDRHAGGSRNDGMAVANGKWLLFADADDYYTPDAFDIYYSKINTDADIVFTGMGGIYEDTGEVSHRGDEYATMVHDYCIGLSDETVLRYRFSSPCCKMVSHDLVIRHQLKYDEIRASNDTYFSLTSGYFAKKIEAVDAITYIASVNRGSLTKRRDYDVIKARLFSAMHCNQFFKQKKLYKQQQSIMRQLYEARFFSLYQKWVLIKMIIKFRQNPFVGCSRWVKSYAEVRKREKNDGQYIVR